tara:strand:- start:186 stop:647 length:462 start_codon:yes stop_codon:yes gene_type:complete
MSFLLKNTLTKCTKENTSFYRFDNKKYYCKVIDIYDGDTITVAIKLNNKIFKHKVRMYGYDTPELKPRKNIPNRNKIIENAKYTKKILEELILNKIVVIRIERPTWDKYGRLLGTIFTKLKWGMTMRAYTFDVNAFMLSIGSVNEYFGGTKKN